MNRNLQKAITDYKKRFEKKDSRGDFAISDIYQIIELSTEEGSIMPDPFTLSANALRAGYMLGYRAARREMQSNAAECRKATAGV